MAEQDDVSAVKRLAILAEEFGEYANAVCDHDVPEQRAELVQVAAVALANVELIDILAEVDDDLQHS